jgi:hypothetical protein
VKAILEFDLTEEAYQHESAIHGADYRRALADVLEELRNVAKYGGNKDETKADFADRLRTEIYDGLHEIPQP